MSYICTGRVVHLHNKETYVGMSMTNESGRRQFIDRCIELPKVEYRAGSASIE